MHVGVAENVVSDTKTGTRHSLVAADAARPSQEPGNSGVRAPGRQFQAPGNGESRHD